MKKYIIAICGLALASGAFAGTETYSGKQTAVQTPPCPEWYRDTEWNVNLWGTYVFTGSEWRNDTYLGVDHAWGGGGDVKFFFHRYFGVGLEGYALALGNNRSRSFTTVGGETFEIEAGNESVVGSVLGTFTFRYPIPCSRFAPYAFVGGGGIFGGGSRSILLFDSDGDLLAERHNNTESKLVGQFGGGFEVRFTPTIGWTNDFSWNVVDGSHNNFGMVRTGINFAF